MKITFQPPTPDQEAYLRACEDEGFDPTTVIGGPNNEVASLWRPFDTAPIEVRAIDGALRRSEKYDRGVVDFVGTDADGCVLIVGRDAVSGEAKAWCRLPKPTW